jgi:hypothetical protein
MFPRHGEVLRTKLGEDNARIFGVVVAAYPRHVNPGKFAIGIWVKVTLGGHLIPKAFGWV